MCMVAYSGLDLRVLRALRAEPAHGYDLARTLAEGGARPDVATVYRRLRRLASAGLVRRRAERGRGPERQVYALSAAGEEALRDDLREAMRALLEAYDARWRGGGRGGDGAAWRRLRGPLAFVSGSRLSGIELRILAALAGHLPRQVHLVLPPGVPVPGAAPPGVAVVEAPWAALPFRDAYAGVVMVNELPPARGLARAAAEWRRVLRPGGTLHVIAPAPLPRGVDAFVDFLADLHDELYPDQAAAPPPPAVRRALKEAFGRVEEAEEGHQRVWTCRLSRGARPARRAGPRGTATSRATTRGRR